MKCPICGARLSFGADRCPDCGCHMHSYTIPVEEAPPRRSRKSRGRVILTILGMLPVLFIIVFTTLISVSVRMEQEPAIPEPESWQSVIIPDDSVPSALPDASEGCFAIQNGAVTFLSDEWEGGRVLRIPGSVGGQEVLSLAPGCFSGCTELTTIVLPETLTGIGDNAFDGCKNLRGLYVPESVEYIGADAFAGCVSLDAIYISASMTAIEEGCFTDCAGLLYIFYEGTFEDWNALYDGYITPFTIAICLDGSHHHGTGR